MTFNSFDYNREAWDRNVEYGVEWTRPVPPETIAAARRGEWQISLTEHKPVPRSWFPADLHGCRVLCLAGAGGQQGPVLAAAGAQVTVLDASPRQLAQDRFVAQRDGLDLETVEGDMRDLSAFALARFDLILHPVSNLFVPAVRPVWAECYRVLRPGGALLAGFMNPLSYIFDRAAADRGELVVRHKLPYSDLDSLSEAELQQHLARGEALEWGHTLEDQIGGQIEAGFVITGFFEDYHSDHPAARYTPTYVVTRAVKPES